MPYIKQEYRDAINTDFAVENPGELNYAITCLIRDYYNIKPSYFRINDVLGALEGAKLEFYRRVAVPYEDKKKEENGDVYPN